MRKVSQNNNLGKFTKINNLGKFPKINNLGKFLKIENPKQESFLKNSFLFTYTL